MVNIYSVYDNDRKMYANPFFTDGSGDHVSAIRVFKAQLFDRSNLIALFPDKFDLYYLGEFDETTGYFTSDMEECELVITGSKALEELRNESVQE